MQIAPTISTSWPCRAFLGAWTNTSFTRPSGGEDEIRLARARSGWAQRPGGRCRSRLALQKQRAGQSADTLRIARRVEPRHQGDGGPWIDTLARFKRENYRPRRTLIGVDLRRGDSRFLGVQVGEKLSTDIELGMRKGVLRAAELGRWEGIRHKPTGIAPPYGTCFVERSKVTGHWLAVSETYVTLGCRDSGCRHVVCADRLPSIVRNRGEGGRPRLAVRDHCKWTACGRLVW
jgi:hypothetical protein